LKTTNSAAAALVLGLAATACANNANVCPQTPSAPAPASPLPGASPPANAPASAASPSASAGGLTLLLRPLMQPSPLVHVELDFGAIPSPLGAVTIRRGAPERIARATARDAKGDLVVKATATGAAGGVTLGFDREPSGSLHLAYDVLSGDDAPDDPLGILVQDDRFRAGGEELVAVPASLEDVVMPFALRIDGEPQRLPVAASSLGVGAVKRTSLPPRALRYACFLAGSVGAMVIDDPSAGHDEGAWLGYTAFDARPVVAEIAQTRTAMAESLGSHADTPWTYLFVSQTRPIGSFSTTPRAASVLVELGPSQPWTAGLKLSIAQQLARTWFGGELRVASEPGHDAEGWWFSEGIARYFATRVLGHAGLIGPGDVRDAIGGELSVLATSPLAGKSNAELAAMAAKDDVARATLTARGALYAARESAAIRARTKGEHGLEAPLTKLTQRAEDDKKRTFTVADWIAELAKLDPDAAKTFDALVVKGAPMTLAAGTLGPCFRAGVGDYVAFDPGFDVETTRISKDARVAGVREGGPAAKAGLKDGDVVASMTLREGDPDVPVKLVVTRGASQVSITYAPKGVRGRGQTWTRVKGIADDKCGDVL
jgi:hypothetical protein